MIDAPVGEHQRFLRDVFCVGVVAERRQRRSIDRAAMALDQLAESCGIASPHLRDQFAVGHLSIEMSKGHTLYRRPDGRHCWVAGRIPHIRNSGSGFLVLGSEVLVLGSGFGDEAIMSRRVRNREPRTGTQNPQPGTENRGLRWRAALLVLAGAIVYVNSLSAPFIFDDQIAIVENPAIRSLSGAWTQPHNTPLAGRPVAGFTFALNFAANDVDAAAYRATNIAVHIACALLLFGLVRRTLALPRLEPRVGGAASDLAFASALLWVVHPLTTDAVTYITQRTESLMALCYLLTLYASLRSHDRRSTMDDRRWTIVAVIACALGMGVKESMVTAPVMVVLFDRAFLFDSFRAAVAVRWRLYAALAFTWVVLAFQLVATPRAGSAGFATGVSVWTYLLNQSVMIVRYLRLARLARRASSSTTDRRSLCAAGCPSARSRCCRAVVADGRGVSMECCRGISRRVVIHHARAFVELRSDRH